MINKILAEAAFLSKPLSFINKTKIDLVFQDRIFDYETGKIIRHSYNGNLYSNSQSMRNNPKYTSCTLLALIAFIFATSSCHKNIPIESKDTLKIGVHYSDTLIHNGGMSGAGIGIPYTAEYFPNWQGDEWTYEVTDSLHHNQRYQATIKILSGSMSPRKWLVSLPYETDTIYIASHDDTIDFLPSSQITPAYNPPFFSLGIRIIWPFYRGMKWQYNPYPTKASVIGLDTLSENNFGYPGKLQAFNLTLFAGGGTEYGATFRIAFAPNIGIISIDRSVLNTLPVIKEHWELINYKLDSPIYDTKN